MLQTTRALPSLSYENLPLETMQAGAGLEEQRRREIDPPISIYQMDRDMRSPTNRQGIDKRK